MATQSSTFSLLLLTSLLALSTTVTVATIINPLTIPSCVGHPSLVQCANDIEFAIVGHLYAGINIGLHTMDIIEDSIKAAKASYMDVLHLLKCHQFDFADSKLIQSDFQLALAEIKAILTILHGKSASSPSDLQKVRTNLECTNQRLSKCAGKISTHPNASINLSLRSLIDQSISLTALSLKIVQELCGKISVHS